MTEEQRGAFVREGCEVARGQLKDLGVMAGVARLTYTETLTKLGQAETQEEALDLLYQQKVAVRTIDELDYL